MREFQHKKRWKKYVYSWFSVAILFLLVIYFAHAAWGIYMKERQSAEDAEQSAEALGSVKDRYNVLASGIAGLNTDEGVEEQIRSDYSVAKPGEHMIVIVNNDDSNADNENASTSIATSTGFWQKVAGFFKF